MFVVLLSPSGRSFAAARVHRTQQQFLSQARSISASLLARASTSSSESRCVALVRPLKRNITGVVAQTPSWNGLRKAITSRRDSLYGVYGPSCHDHKDTLHNYSGSPRHNCREAPVGSADAQPYGDWHLDPGPWPSLNNSYQYAKPRTIVSGLAYT